MKAGASQKVHQKHFTAAEDDAILRGLYEGRSFSIIAAETKRTVNSVTNRFYRTLFKGERRSKLFVPGPSTDGKDIEISNRRDQGEPWDVVAKAVGLPVRTAQRRYEWFQVPYKTQLRSAALRTRKKRNSTELEQLWNLRNEEKRPWREISGVLNRPVHTIRSWYIEMRRERGMAILPRRKPYSTEEEEQLRHLKIELQLPWSEVARRMPLRSLHSLQAKHYILRHDFSAELPAQGSED